MWKLCEWRRYDREKTNNRTDKYIISLVFCYMRIRDSRVNQRQIDVSNTYDGYISYIRSCFTHHSFRCDCVAYFSNMQWQYTNGCNVTLFTLFIVVPKWPKFIITVATFWASEYGFEIDKTENMTRLYELYGVRLCVCVALHCTLLC